MKSVHKNRLYVEQDVAKSRPQLRMCVVTLPSERGSSILAFLSNFIDIIHPASRDVFIIGSNFTSGFNNVHVLAIKADSLHRSWLHKAFEYFRIQLRTVVSLARISRKIDVVIFHFSGPLVMPAILAKLLRKKVVFSNPGLASHGLKFKFRNKFARYLFTTVFGLFEGICFSIANQVWVPSPSFVRFHSFEKYGDKIAVNGATYVDTSFWKMKDDVLKNGKENIIGFVGRLGEEKGVMNLVRAMPLVLKARSDVRLIIRGNGYLMDEIQQQVKDSQIEDVVTFVGWVNRDELPDYYNQMKVLVLPSLSEGIPVTIQESMACGTPVLATPVGSIPDLIKDGETGFIMDNNTPECIAENIIRALDNPELNDISMRARQFMEQNYTLEVMVEKCEQTLQDLVNGIKGPFKTPVSGSGVGSSPQ